MKKKLIATAITTITLVSAIGATTINIRQLFFTNFAEGAQGAGT